MFSELKNFGDVIAINFNIFLKTLVNIVCEILPMLSLIVPLLLSVAFFTLYERHFLAALQRRQGPNIVGFFGLLQPIADGLKLLLKESIFPKSADTLIFIFAPIFAFGLAISGWSVIPASAGSEIADFNLSLFFIFGLSSLGVHSIIMAGWSSNSKYAFLGGLRSAAQMISYEVSFASIILSILIVVGSLNFSNIIEQQADVFLWKPLFPVLILFFISILAETNRHPFDLPEAEAELVSGYNVEYAAMGFALFFLAEYSNIILMSKITAILFLGGWFCFSRFPLLFLLPGALNSAIKTMIFTSLFVSVRGILPRYRYDHLMRLGWKVFLPFGLLFVLLFALIIVLTFGYSWF